jgi:L-rhamnose-H+ transport protein
MFVRLHLMANPLIGLVLHWLGGLASGSFYVPFRRVRVWSWETYWLVGGFFSWIIAPWSMAGLLTERLGEVLSQTPGSTWFWCYFFGALWGLGNLTFGLTMRFLGMSLGMAVALGYCAAFGTLMPPLFNGEFFTKVLGTTSGVVVLLGIVVCLLGIACAGAAGISKEKELPEAQKKAAIKEFNLRKGLAVATVSGILSACFSYGLAAGGPIRELTLAAGTADLWQGLPVLIVVLLGGFTTNFLSCVYLHVKNRTGGEYMSTELVREGGRVRVPMVNNYLFSATAGVTWYLQFFFYSMGETQMGEYRFSSWTLHMASIILFSTLWGLALGEWRGTSSKTMRLLFLSIFVLVLSTVVVGYGNYLGSSGTGMH